MSGCAGKELTFTALSLGSNQGDRRFYIEEMARELRTVLAGCARASRVMETGPVGVEGRQPAYLNMVVAGYYGGDAYTLLDSCLSIEARLGRVRAGPKAPRTADVDILLFGAGRIYDPPGLVVPHPELLNRRFCLEGLMGIDSSIPVPVNGRLLTAGELYKNMEAGVAAQDVSFLQWTS
jgi:2-amino-4-hydroxy-6-hydroxymethyldihydropteridine diphosphokinase